MIVFVDTSAIYALLDGDDAKHKDAKNLWVELINGEASLICSNYILIECFSLIQNRLGIEAVSDFQNDLLPIIKIEWVDETIHQAGISALLTAGRRELSLVDCISFAVMRKLGIEKVFTFDQHFREQRFLCLPE